MADRILLDSTYLLPTFGMEVEGISDEDLKGMRELLLRGDVEFFCLSTTWIELIGKICREAERRGIDVAERFREAVKSLMEGGYYRWIEPSAEDILMAFNLRRLGHRDIIDNLLYAASINRGMKLLTMDRELKEFLRRHNYKIDHLIDHSILLERG